tara:strand:+ start:403 stop:801 length:399 start_codon:yes stop_codon:yes gene_type:complete
MKKLLGIVALGFLLSGNVYAKCITVSSCPKPPNFSEYSIRANVHDHGWQAKKVFKDFRKKILFEKKTEEQKKIFNKFFNLTVQSYTDEYFITKMMTLYFMKIDPSTGFNGEWVLKCNTIKNTINCEITGPKF